MIGERKGAVCITENRAGKPLLFIQGMNRRSLRGGEEVDGTGVRRAKGVYCSGMSKQKPKDKQAEKEPRRTTPTFLLELPLIVNEGQAKRLRGHLEAGRALYNAVLSEGQKRMRRMRADSAWQAARAIPKTQKQARRVAFAALRQRFGFSEYTLHEYAKTARVCWIADHLDVVLAQTLASRAYRALNRVCLGEARRVRFKSRGRGLSSLENKRNDTGLRFCCKSQSRAIAAS
jgi:hypothetical protein